MLRFGVRYVFRLSSQCKPQNQIETRLKGIPVITDLKRSIGFFNRLKGESLSKAITSVSNAGRKRGRGKAALKRAIPNLNMGQVIGEGAANIKWPGLSSDILQGQEVGTIVKLPPDPDYYAKIIESRSQGTKKRSVFRVHPLERGWSAKNPCGKMYGPPEVADEDLKNFESTVLEVKYLKTKRSILGSVRTRSVYAVTGNGNGILGVGTAKSTNIKSAIKKAIKVAASRLIYFKLEDKTTLNHDFYYKMGMVKVFAYKKPPGYGLVCHRGIAECCKLIGIKDIYAKVEGSRNKQHTIKAFLLGLLEQKSYQQMADEKQLHLVEMRKEKMYYPTVLASPAVVSKSNDSDETFSEYVMGGKLTLRRPKKPIELQPRYELHLKKMHYKRNHDEVRLKLLLEYGECRSFLADIYPECRFQNIKRKSGEDESVQL